MKTRTVVIRVHADGYAEWRGLIVLQDLVRVLGIRTEGFRTEGKYSVTVKPSPKGKLQLVSRQSSGLSSLWQHGDFFAVKRIGRPVKPDAVICGETAVRLFNAKIKDRFNVTVKKVR